MQNHAKGKRAGVTAPGTPQELDANFYPAGQISEAARQLPVLLHRAREALAMRLRTVSFEHNLTDPQWRVLRILSHSAGIDASNLARLSFLMGPSLSRILRDLAGRGLIVRRVSATDARRYLHSLTPKGQRLIKQVAPGFEPVLKDIEDRFGVADIERLNASLAALLEAVQAPADATEEG